MIEVSQAFQDAWLNGNQKYIQLDFSDNSSLDDDSIVSESFTMRQALCEESQLAFGLTSSTEVTIQILNSGKQYKGLYMSILVGAVDDENHYYTMDLGTYKIEDDVRSDDRLYRTLTAYDALYGVLNEDYSAWYSTLNDTFTLKQFRDSFFSHIGITQETFTLAQDSVTLNKKPNVTSLSGRDILQGICETSASFGFINYTGKFQYVTPTIGSRHFPSDDLYPSNTLYPGDGADIVIDGSSDEGAPIMGGLVYSDYYTHKITGAAFVYSENTPSAQSGTTTNVYQFSDSILFYGQDSTALQGIASNFLVMASAFFYIPSQIKCRARIWAQPGDLLLVQAGANSVLMPILEREMTGITALYDTYEAKGTEYYVYSANSITARMTENEARTSENTDAIDVIDDDINNPVTGVKVTIEKTANEIKTTVAGTQKEWDTTGYTITLYGYDTPANEGYAPTSHSGAYYLNQTNGYIYYSNGLSWSYVKTCSTIQAVLQSSITQNANAIELKVSKGNVTSQLLLENDTISLTSGRLVISSGNFQLNSSGYVTCSGGTFSGNIYLGEANSAYHYSSGGLYYNCGGSYSGVFTGYGYQSISKTDYAPSFGGWTSEYLTGYNLSCGINRRYSGRMICDSKIYAQPAINTSYSCSTVLTSADIPSLGYATSSDLSSVRTTANNASSAADDAWREARSAASDASDAYTRANQAYALADGCLDSVTTGSSTVGTWTTWNNHNVVNDIYKSGSSVCATRYNVNTSDLRLKEWIVDMPDFTNAYMKFKPKEFNFHHDLPYQDHGRHYGLIAQDFKSICDEEGINLNDNLHSIWHTRDVEIDGNECKYIGDGRVQVFVTEDLHAIHIQMIQKQQRQIDDLVAKISELEEVLNGISKSEQDK